MNLFNYMKCKTFDYSVNVMKCCRRNCKSQEKLHEIMLGNKKPHIRNKKYSCPNLSHLKNILDL